MNKRWRVALDGVNFSDTVTPVNGANITFNSKRELTKGQVFYRKEISGPLIFKNPDYAKFLLIEQQPSKRCYTILIVCEIQCNSLYQELWRGEFSTGSGSFDLDRCLFTVKPQVVDKYSCLLAGDKVKYNILQAENVTANVIVLPSLEFAACVITLAFPVGCEDYIGNAWTSGHGQNVVPPDACDDNYTLGIRWREKLTTECVGGSPSTPPGVGWVLLTDDCATNGTATYVRETTIPWTFGDAVSGTIVDGVPMPPDSDCMYAFAGIVENSPFCPALPWYVCLSAGDSLPIPGARKLESAANFLVDQLDCGLAGVRSELFSWNIVSTTDYVTGLPTDLNNLLIAQNTDVADPLPTNPATIGEMSFMELTKLLIAFQVYWDIDPDGYVRFEHWTYWEGGDGINIGTFPKTIEPQAYTHLTEEIPQLERLVWMEAQGRDFVGKDIVYSGPCVSQGENEEEYAVGKVISDVSFVLSDPANIPRIGFVLMASTFNGSTYDVIIGTGAITGNFVTNAPLSTANLEANYWTYNRYLPTGRLNGVETIFNSFRPTIEQIGVIVPICCDILEFDPKDKITTDLGERLGGISGQVESSAYSLKSGSLSLTLRYSY